MLKISFLVEERNSIIRHIFYSIFERPTCNDGQFGSSVNNEINLSVKTQVFLIADAQSNKSKMIVFDIMIYHLAD
jgi:hypothetical protein